MFLQIFPKLVAFPTTIKGHSSCAQLPATRPCVGAKPTCLSPTGWGAAAILKCSISTVCQALCTIHQLPVTGTLNQTSRDKGNKLTWPGNSGTAGPSKSTCLRIPLSPASILRGHQLVIQGEDQGYLIRHASQR